jgi:hypothetical protein
MAMPELTAKRTLVKSPPELWEELSEVERLARHLGAFGEIKISKLDPEHTVAWEGEHASGTVSIEPSGWGTRVTLTAELATAPDEARAEAAPEPEAARAEVAPEADDPQPDAAAGPEAPAGAEAPAAPEPEPAAPEPKPAVEAPEPQPIPAPPPAPARPSSRWRTFWARFFSGWLVADERLNPPAADERLNPPAAEDRLPPHAPQGPLPEPVDIAPPEDPPPAEPPAPAAEEDPPTAIDPGHAESVLNETLDALGAAHHRPYSRP